MPARDTGLIESVENVLATFVAAESIATRALDPRLDPLVRVASDAVLGGGKRLRPLFAFWGWRACGGRQPIDAVVPALAALELLHAFALVHDDVMDRSETRRGRPSAHRALAAVHSRQRLHGDSGAFGDSAAILVGNLCLVWADELMGRARVPAGDLMAARQAYDRMRVEAIAGQYLDVLGAHSAAWTLEQALRTARLKTAGYTVVRPLQFGGSLSGRLEPVVAEGFSRYGFLIGEAFQLCDDLLGAFGSPDITGKPVGDDLVQAKPTALLHIARAAATDEQRAEIDHLLDRCARGDGGADEGTARKLADLILATGAAERVRTMIADRVEAGCAALTSIPIDAEARAALVELAEAVAYRSM